MKGLSNSPRVTIITVNYKQPRVTCELLCSISKLTYPNLETIVVDNAQTDDDSNHFKNCLNKVQVINIKDNIGFAGGNNIGIKKSTGDFILLLNNDTEIKNGVIEGLIDVYKNNENIGAVSPILKYHDTPEKIQFAGFTKVNSLTGRNELIQAKPPKSLIQTPYFHGAAVMIPKQIIEECGLMPEEYFLYYEELEWSRCIVQKGYEIKVATDLEVYHKESITTGKNSPLKVYYQNRNRIHFMKKGPSSIMPFVLFFFLFSIPKNVISHLLNREIKHLIAFTKAVNDGFISPKYGQQPFA